MIIDAKQFINHRKEQERKATENIENSFSTLFSIEINITELCNRTCVFCPRVNPKIYPNRNIHMNIEVVDRIISELVRLNYKGKISFSGFGEPLLNKDFSSIVKKFRDFLPENVIECNTNGDKLSSEKIDEIFNSGLSKLYINMYDGPDQIEIFKNMISNSSVSEEDIFLRPHWKNCESNEWGLILNNRSGAVENISKIKTFPLQKKCNFPFYKMFIDWNGDVLICCNDWLRKKIIMNVMNSSIDDIWLSKEFNDIRKKLSVGNREDSPCSSCDVDGEISGEKSFSFFISNILYEQS